MGIDSSFMENRWNRFHILTDPLTGKAGTEEVPNSAMHIIFPRGLYSVVTIRNGRLTIAIISHSQTKSSTIGATVTPLFKSIEKLFVSEKRRILAV